MKNSKKSVKSLVKPEIYAKDYVRKLHKRALSFIFYS